MNSVFEASATQGEAQISCKRYRNLHNIPHYHSDHELIYVNEGRAQIAVNEQLFKVTDGEGVFVMSHAIHHVQADESTVITVLKADRDFFDRIFAARVFSSPRLTREANVGGFLDSIREELQKSDEHSALMATCLTACFFITLLRTIPTVERKHVPADRVSTQESYRSLCRMIATEYRTITFREAARRMNFSEPHFSKIFHSTFGMTFTRYLNTVRIAAALEKLKQGNMSITEIAGSCGFNTIRNFNRVFKAFTGYSPQGLPSDYVFLYSLQDGYGLDPTLNCSVILEEQL